VRRPIAAIAVAVLVGSAAAIVASETWHGPTLLSFSGGHGLDTGDLLAVPLVVLAIAVWRRRAESGAPSPGWAGSAAAIALGSLLLLAGITATDGGGPLVPAGGGTLAGKIEHASARSAVPVGRWSDVAVTYDGASLRLYVNGREVSSRGAGGEIQISQDPLWIGGNQPYGEFFHGVIDEVRVYSRALDADEVRADMARPVAPAEGLMAAYAFDAGSGTTAADSSGHGNAGAIRHAVWTRGRFGRALSFDGAGAVVSVPPSRSLNLTHAMTLSGWVLPSAEQDGWRTIVQRQADAYLLTAGSGRAERVGRLDDLRAALVVAALAWFCAAIAMGRAPRSAARRRSWWQPAALFVAGSLVDAALAPTGTLVAPALVAAWLAFTAASRAEAVAFALAAAGFAGLTVASLAEVSAVEDALAPDDGAAVRAVALGALFVLAGAVPLLGRSRI
jgi:concanavalin A-like lectin/glucanase superfamily protein